jgi:hypothetical protein
MNITFAVLTLVCGLPTAGSGLQLKWQKKSY